MRKLLIGIALCLVAFSSCSVSKQTDSETVGGLCILLGSYCPADSSGIRLYDFDEATGDFHPVCSLNGIANPSYLAVASDKHHFYAVSEMDDSTAALYAAEIVTEGDSTTMRILNHQLTGGEAPCYVNLYERGQIALTANYNGSSLSAFGIDADGTLLPEPQVIEFEGKGPNTGRQEKSHIHCVEFTPDSALLLVNDLGGDRINTLTVNPQAQTSSPNAMFGKYGGVDVKPGSGPRHITFAPNGRFAYLINELSGMVTVLEYKDLTLIPRQYALCDSVEAQGSADIHVSPDGKFLYASNRLKADGISIFSINQENGTITKVGYQLTGAHPRNFAISPNGVFILCACRDDNSIWVFRRDKNTGMTTDTGKRIMMPNPVCVKFIDFQ